ncbi:hypothetical protein Tco_1383428 [Tanacetum coccineum]
MSHEEVVEITDTDSDAESIPTCTLKESSKSKTLTKFTYITKKDVVDKVKYDKYCLKMLNRRAQGKIINCDVLKRGKDHINLKVYRDDGSEEIIQNYKISDLHLGEWKKLMDACPKRTRAGWTTIHAQTRQKPDALHKTEQELELDLSIPLEEQDPIIKLNLLGKKKRKHADDLHDYFKSTKRSKKSVQYGDCQVGIILNEPTLRMILFNSRQRQDFINIEDFEELNNDMLYHVQDIFFRLRQGPGMYDLARTFSSFLVAEVDKRNLNPLKKIRLIEQLRQ